MAPKIMLYGVTGYTGGLAAEEMVKLGLYFVVGGRSADKVQAKADALSVGSKVFSLESPAEIDEAIKGFTVVFNAAGPYFKTAGSLMDGCIRNGVHYADLAAETFSFAAAEKRDQAARDAGVILLPGGGGVAEVFMDCLVGHVLKRTPNATHVDQVLDMNGPLTRGTIETIRSFTIEHLQKRVGGKLVQNDFNNTITVDFNDGRGELIAPPTGDPQLYTLWKFPGISNIRTFIHKSGEPIPTAEASTLPFGPTTEQLDATPYQAVAIVSSADGSKKKSILRMANGYVLTAQATAMACKILAEEDHGDKAGWVTPLQMFGSDYPLSFKGSSVADVD
ncbi:hypothetical protein TGAM01_v208957 [Trichoderma gamsii]|uniref:Saccharopine dehydrogenase NADP binding domain-containing protein n=1 Tax=Trichoderma gamsii TaxID=398673 RepID=A0A2P4ZCT4_9HYPO|nr:hypothetical protein TGAM01_v208957 [Trichoderma gamsii]PON22083.1 hypothetical protein TGAM01_v208957 [Trichoderma gamsii]